MHPYLQRSSIDPKNLEVSQQKNQFQQEKKSVQSFQEKNITIQDRNKKLKDKISQEKEFLLQKKPQQSNTNPINIGLTQEQSKRDENFIFQQIDKQFNELKLDSNQKMQNKSFNKIFLKFLSYEIQNVMTFEIKNLIRVQRKLDEHLIYLKNMRNKLLGLSFKEIKRKLWSSSQANLSVQVFKQIIYLAPHFYQTKYSHLIDGQFPYLIRFPKNHDSTQQRNFQFKKLIYSYILKTKVKNQNQQKNLKEVQIPMVQNDFFKQKITRQSLTINEQLSQKKVDIFFKKKETPVGFSPFSILDNSSDFKETLYFLIRQKQLKLKQMQQENTTPIK